MPQGEAFPNKNYLGFGLGGCLFRELMSQIQGNITLHCNNLGAIALGMFSPSKRLLCDYGFF